MLMLGREDQATPLLVCVSVLAYVLLGVGYMSAMLDVRVMCVSCSDERLLAALLVLPQDACHVVQPASHRTIANNPPCSQT